MSATDIHDPNRRDFLYVATGMAAVVGAGALAGPVIDKMRPHSSTLALASERRRMHPREEKNGPMCLLGGAFRSLRSPSPRLRGLALTHVSPE